MRRIKDINSCRRACSGDRNCAAYFFYPGRRRDCYKWMNKREARGVRGDRQTVCYIKRGMGGRRPRPRPRPRPRNCPKCPAGGRKGNLIVEAWANEGRGGEMKAGVWVKPMMGDNASIVRASMVTLATALFALIAY